ncbi:MAG: DUF1499 domain-containing protein [Gammaproteobacteria bacterium]
MNPTSATGPASLARWVPRVVFLSLIIGILAVFTVLLPGPLYRIRVYGLYDAFEMIKYGTYGGILAVLIAITGLILVLLTRRPKYFIGAVIGMLSGIVAWGIPHPWLKKIESMPAMHDISTDTVNPPRFQPEVLALRNKAQNSAVYAGAETAAQQAKAYPDIQPMVFKLAATTVYAAALRTVQAMGWKLDSNDPVSGIIEATATTFWFGLKDDVVIRIQAVGKSTRLDIRSESRVGKSDAGKNTQLIRTFRAALYKQLGLQALGQ